MNSIREKDEQIKDYVKTHFAFLLDAGFVINPVKHTGALDQWELIVSSKTVWVKFESDRNEISLYINPKHEDFWISLTAMVYYLTKGKVLPAPFEGDLFKDRDKQYQRLAQLLQSYWIEIQQLCTNKTSLSSDEFGEISYKILDARLKG